MALHTWTFDAPDNVWKNHALSTKLRDAAIAKTVFVEHTTPEPGYGRKKGESITIGRMANITEPSNPRLVEGQRIPEDEFDLSTVQITVAEIGRALPYTNLVDEFSKYDVTNRAQKKLMEQLSLALDTMAAAKFKGCKVKAIPSSVSALTFDTDGTPSSTALANYTVAHAALIRDYMFDTLHTPFYDGSNYMCIARTKALRGIKDDPEFEEWHKYTDPQKKFDSEVGRIEQIRHLETNHSQALGTKNSDLLGEAVFFGDDAVAMVETMSPELRAAPKEDFGRQGTMAWYGILEFGEIWPTANAGEARIVHLTSDV